jgi:hypothetical protein
LSRCPFDRIQLLLILVHSQPLAIVVLQCVWQCEFWVVIS